MRGMIGMMGVALLASAALGVAAPTGHGAATRAVACLAGDGGVRAVMITTTRTGRMLVRAPGQRARVLRVRAVKSTGPRRTALVRRAKTLESRQRLLDARCARAEVEGGSPSSSGADELPDIVGLEDLLSLAGDSTSESTPEAAPTPPSVPWVCDPRVGTACLPTPECYFAMYDNDPDADAICRRVPAEEPTEPADPTPQL